MFKVKRKAKPGQFRRWRHALKHDAGTADDDDRLIFAAPPGLEYVAVNDDCRARGEGLRIRE